MNNQSNQPSKKPKNFVKFIGAGLILISALLLPWYNFPLLGSGRILEVRELAESGGQNALVILTFILVLVAGIIAVFKAKAGAIIGIIGLVFSFIIAAMLASDVGSSGFSFLYFGFYIALIGIIACLFSNKIYKTLKKG